MTTREAEPATAVGEAYRKLSDSLRRRTFPPGTRLPVAGLTIRISFDANCPPSSAWWYAELEESERYDEPPPGDRHLLPLAGNEVRHTFTEQACVPRESYGIAFSWPDS